MTDAIDMMAVLRRIEEVEAIDRANEHQRMVMFIAAELGSGTFFVETLLEAIGRAGYKVTQKT